MESLGTAPGWGAEVGFLRCSVVKCLKGTAPSYFSEYFQLKRHNIHDYDIRNKNKLVIDRVKLESTKRAFFYKGADIFNNCI